MKLIVGLGNPGNAYAGSRHNVGFSVLEALAKAQRITLKRDFRVHALGGKGKIEGEEAVLAKPLTFMNLSGIAIKALLKKYKIDLKDLLVVCDDLDLEPGRIRVRKSGSSGGHRGLKSIIGSLATQDFSRLRVGIGRPGVNLAACEYVLSSFTKKEKEIMAEKIDEACECVRAWISKRSD